MNIYESAEDYLERILIITKEKGKVISLDIAKSMNYSKPSISRAMKNLKIDGYILIDDLGYITLTEKGYEIASRIYERHVLLAKYFVSLGVSPDIALTDACKVEHDLSDETFEAIKKHANLYNNEQK
ncbi:MAG: metal-dependent transcriptional regulator [Bacilli bacterium]